jgi:hypothetical protein
MSVFQRPIARWVAFGALIASAVAEFVRVDGTAHSVSDTLIGVAPLWSVCVIAAWWVIRLGRSKRP